MEPLRVLVLTDRLFPQTGTRAAMATAMAAEAGALGHKVTVLVPHWPFATRSNGPSMKWPPGVQIKRSLLWGVFARMAAGHTPRLGIGSRVFRALEILALFVVCLLQGRQDAVLTPRATPCGNVAAALSRAWGCGVFLQMTGDEIFPGRWGNRTLHLLRGAMDGAHRIHVPSVLFAEALRRIHPPAAGRVHGAAPWVPLSGLAREPIDQSVFANLPKDAFVVVAPTRLVHWRGVDTLLLAMADLRNSGDSVHLVVLGDGPQREELEAMAETLFLRRRDVPGGVDLVTFIGETPAVQTWMERADAVAFAARTHPETARAEGTALIALEAALLGKPLILGRAGAAAEHFQDGETALLIQPATDPAAYADGIRRLIREPELREKLGRQARATISQVLNPSAQSRAMATILSEIRQNRTDQ